MFFLPQEVKEIARQHGYEELPVGDNERSHLLMFKHPSKQGCGGTTSQCGAVKICVYFTTGTVATSLEHPRAGKGQLMRTVKDRYMLVKVFDNPRVHSNSGYHKTEETRKRHKENGINPRQLTDLACKKYHCTLVPGPPQNKTKLVVFKHPTGFVIEVWFNTGTIGVTREKEKEKVFIKNLTLNSIEKYLDIPRLAHTEIKKSGSSGGVFNSNSSCSRYRQPLADLQQQSSSTSKTADSKLDQLEIQCQQFIVENKSLRFVEKDFLKNIANLHGFNLAKDQQQPPMLQFKSQKSGGPGLNYYPTKGKVLVQGRGGLNETTKNCSFQDFLILLERHGNKMITEEAKNLEVEETPQAKAVRVAREYAAQLLGSNLGKI